MTTNVRIEKTCSANHGIEVQPQEYSAALGDWVDSGPVIPLKYEYELTPILMIHQYRRIVIREAE
jgi:hypothetical protein